MTAGHVDLCGLIAELWESWDYLDPEEQEEAAEILALLD